MSSAFLQLVPGLAAMAALAACSPVHYAPRPLDGDAGAAEFMARSVDSDGLKRFVSENGQKIDAWPPLQWGLRDLTLVALYFHSDIPIARARAQVVRAQRVAPAPWAGSLKPEYHSRTLAEDKGPWTLGLALEIALVAPGKREAFAERDAFLADAAELDVANAAWMVRQRVRDRYVALQASHDALALLDAQLTARGEMLGLVTRRVEAGMLSARDLAAERLVYSQAQLSRGEETARQQRARGELAQALAVPLEVVDRMPLRFDPAPAPQLATQTGALRRMALRNRLDVHRLLLEFGAADAALKASVAAQNPDITLGPGYAWDQGDNVWSLAIGLSLPPAGVKAAIREAHARRELAAAQFEATQVAAISIAEQVGAQLRLAQARIAAAEQQVQVQQDQEARTIRQFATGAADRMQRVAARLDTLMSEMALHLARVEATQALSRVEDAVQRPLMGDFQVLPDVQALPDTGGTRAGRASTP